MVKHWPAKVGCRKIPVAESLMMTFEISWAEIPGEDGWSLHKFGEFIEIHSGLSGFVPCNGLYKELRMSYRFLGILPDLSDLLFVVARTSI